MRVRAISRKRPNIAAGESRRSIRPIAHAHAHDAAQIGMSGIPEIARALVNNPFWDFWWD
jgi:hypothetical protein